MEQEDLKRFGGLSPKAALVVGGGFSREEVKSLFLEAGVGLTTHSVLSLSGLAQKWVREANADRMLGPQSRQEILRSLLSDRRISEKTPELKRLRRQKSFFKKLDRAVQAGRLAPLHSDEERVWEERLVERLGSSPIRNEVRLIARAFDAWCESMDLWDDPRVLRVAHSRLREGLLPDELRDLSEICRLSADQPESLELGFWQELGRLIPVREIVWARAHTDVAPPVRWLQWHTLDDAAEYLAEALSQQAAVGYDAILIPDQPAVRRSITRALKRWGINLSDPRDPTQLKTAEGFKRALLPLRLVARGFEASEVIEWIRGSQNLSGPDLAQEFYSRGIRKGLTALIGPCLTPLREELEHLLSLFCGRKTLREVADRHIEWVKGDASIDPDRRVWISFFEDAWRELEADLILVSHSLRAAPLLFWLEKLESRLEDASPPVDYSRPKYGVSLYRLAQAPLLERVQRLWILGLPARWLHAEGIGDYWYNDRDRELLGHEFALRSPAQVSGIRTEILKSWMARSLEVHFLDAQYDWDGRERESLIPVLRELQVAPMVEPLICGSVTRFLPSHRPPRALTLLPIEFGRSVARSMEGQKPVIRATEIDRYGACSFTALAQYRWRLKDLRLPEAELWPDVRGNILHDAAQALVGSRQEDGSFAVTIGDALDRAWKKNAIPGLLEGKRLQNYAKNKMLPILKKFCAEESVYALRSGTKVWSMEGPAFKIEFEDFWMIGRPDRIDEHPDGLFVIDYKTSTKLPSGLQMLEGGYRLQLPFYAIAAQKQWGARAIGVQFVELTRGAKRSKGVFFKPWIGKKPGSLLNTNTRNKSLLTVTPEAAWAEMEAHLVAQAHAYLANRFQAKPGAPSECQKCRFDDLCGIKRQMLAEASGDRVEEMP